MLPVAAVGGAGCEMMAGIAARVFQNWRASATQVAFNQVRNGSVLCKRLEFKEYGDPMEVISKVEEEISDELQPNEVCRIIYYDLLIGQEMLVSKVGAEGCTVNRIKEIACSYNACDLVMHVLLALKLHSNKTQSSSY